MVLLCSPVSPFDIVPMMRRAVRDPRVVAYLDLTCAYLSWRPSFSSYSF